MADTSLSAYSDLARELRQRRVRQQGIPGRVRETLGDHASRSFPLYSPIYPLSFRYRRIRLFVELSCASVGSVSLSSSGVMR